MSITEGWESGLIRYLGKVVCQQWHREFESHTFRHSLRNTRSKVVIVLVGIQMSYSIGAK